MGDGEGELGAFGERRVFKACHVVREDRALQVFTIHERAFPDPGNPFRDGHGGQTAASGERVPADDGDAVRDRHVHQAGFIERVIPDGGDAARDRHILQRGAFIEHRSSDGRYAFCEGRVLQLEAAGEGRVPDIGNAARDCHGRQADAVGERVIADGRHTVRDCEGIHPFAPGKRGIPDSANAVRDRDGPEVCAGIEHPVRNGGYAVRKRHAAQIPVKMENASSDGDRAGGNTSRRTRFSSMEIIRTATDGSRSPSCCFFSAALRIIRYSFVGQIVHQEYTIFYEIIPS